MVKWMLLWMVWVWSFVAYAQDFGSYQSHARPEENRLSIMTAKGQLEITLFDHYIVEVDFKPEGIARPQISKAVVARPDTVMQVFFAENRKALNLVWEGGKVQFVKKTGRLIITSPRKVRVQSLGYRDLDSLEQLVFALEAEEQLYGGGFRALPMDRRGYRLPLYNAPQYGYGMGWEGSNFSIPLFVSSRGYALFLDNPAKGWADLGHSDSSQLRFEMAGGPMTFYCIFGEDPSDLVVHYTHLTGRQPLPPKWALGNFASRFGYKTEAEARAVIDSFCKDSIPVDAIIIDLYWFGKGVRDSFFMGNLRWDREAWPTPEDMIADFDSMGIKTILIAEPFIMQESFNYDNAVALDILATDSTGASFLIEDFWFGPTGLLDIFKPFAREWFWEQYARQIENGVAGWWGDLGEPEKHPSAIRHVTGPADLVHNAYGHWWSELLYDKYTVHYPRQRLFHLNRSGFAGSPRFAAFPWSGDVGRNWSGLEAQLPIMLGMAWCGVPYMHSDLGGFAMGNRDPELYIRWLQMGVFSPIYRPHAGGDIPSEPVFWDDTTKALARQAIIWRYQLLPYNYHLAWEATRYGKPLARPMAFYSQLPHLQNLYSQYYWGRDLLVAPVIAQGARKKVVHFPEQNAWYHWHTGKKYAAGTSDTFQLSRQHIPVFARAGAIIPMRPPFERIAQEPVGEWVIKAFLDNAMTANTTIYEDDGTTRWENKWRAQSTMRSFSVQVDSATRQLLIALCPGRVDVSYVPATEAATLEVYGLAAPPEALVVNGKTMPLSYVETPEATLEPGSACWNAAKNMLLLRVVWNNR